VSPSMMASICIILLCLSTLTIIRYWSTKQPLPSTLRRLGWVVAVLSSLGTYGFLIEPLLLETTYIHIGSEKITQGDSIRIVQFSDLHAPTNKRLHERLLRAIQAQRPDVVVFSGDLADTAEGRLEARELLSRIAESAPVYAVRGNSDDAYDKTLFQVPGVYELSGDSRDIRFGASTLTIVGLPYAKKKGQSVEALSSLDRTKFILHVEHVPDAVKDLSIFGIDLYLAGHTHGGQIALPFYGALVTHSRYGKEFEHGLYGVGNTLLYVNRGIGMAFRYPPMRFAARPELTVFDIGNP